MVSSPSSTHWGSGALGLGTQSGLVWPETVSPHDHSDFHHLESREGKLKTDSAEEAEGKEPSEHRCMEGGSTSSRGACSSSQDVLGASTAIRKLALHRGHHIWPFLASCYAKTRLVSGP